MTANYIIAPGLMNIDDVVSQVWGIRKEDMQIRTRKRAIVEARQVAMWWRIRNTKATLTEIADVNGHLDHATALHAKKTVENLMEVDLAFRKKVEMVEAIMGYQSKK